MQVTLHHRSAHTAAQVHLDKGDSCTTEAGAMIAMSGHLQLTTTTHKKGRGGLLRAAKRLLSGESFFLNHYEAERPGELWLAAGLPGDICEVQVDNRPLVVQAGSFLAASEDVDMDVGWQGFKNLLSGESLFWLQMQGSGNLLMSAFGEIYTVDVRPENGYVVDTGHIVAFERTLDFKLSKAGSSWLHSIIGGEGIVCSFSGEGRIWCQSHNPRSFGQALGPQLKPRKV